jgi:magnesium transporter
MILDLTKSNYALKKELSKIQPFDIATDFHSYPLKEQKKIASLVGKNKMVKIFIELPIQTQIQYFNQLPMKEQKNFINLLPTDELNHFIKNNDKDDRPRLINFLSKQKIVLIEKLLSYDEEDVASIMSTEYIELKPNMTCGEATSYVFKVVKDSDFINLLYVVEKDTLIGIVSLKELIIARKNQSLADVITKDYYFAFDDDSIKSAIEKVKSYNISALPVLSHDFKMIGIITVDDVIEEIHDDIIDTYQKLGFLNDHEDSYSPFNRTLARLPWLLIVLLMNTVFLSVLQVFEQTLTTITVLLLFQPLVLNMSGNIGTQSMAVTILVLSDKSQNIKQTIRKETSVGVLNSLIIGFLGFLMAIGILMLFFSENGIGYSLKFGFVVALSLFSSMFVAALSGTILPIVFYKLGYDVKNASGPILTTINDIVGLTIYFLVATLLIL